MGSRDRPPRHHFDPKSPSLAPVGAHPLGRGHENFFSRVKLGVESISGISFHIKRRFVQLFSDFFIFMDFVPSILPLLLPMLRGEGRPIKKIKLFLLG